MNIRYSILKWNVIVAISLALSFSLPANAQVNPNTADSGVSPVKPATPAARAMPDETRAAAGADNPCVSPETVAPGSVEVILKGNVIGFSVEIIDRHTVLKFSDKRVRFKQIPLIHAPRPNAPGRFIAGTVPAGRYDIRVTGPDGLIADGVPAGPAISAAVSSRSFKLLSKKDRGLIEKKIAGMKSFYDERRVWGMFSNVGGTTARVLIELVRNGNMTYRKIKNPVNWRVELWTYRFEFGTWKRTDATVLDRALIPQADYVKLNRFFAPELGSVLVESGRTTRVTLDMNDILARAASRRGGVSTAWRAPHAANPVGKVILVDVDTGMVVVNIGTDDGVKPGSQIELTPTGNGKPITGMVRSVLNNQCTVYLDSVKDIILGATATLK